eukprot:g25943.t1
MLHAVESLLGHTRTFQLRVPGPTAIDAIVLLTPLDASPPRMSVGSVWLRFAALACLLVLLPFTAWGAANDTAGNESEPLQEVKDERYKVLITVFGMKRLGALERLLRSLESANYNGIWERAQLSLTVRMDKYDGPFSQEIKAMVRGFHFSQGNYTVVWNKFNRGLKRNIMSVYEGQGNPQDKEFLVLLEDDLELSPLWCHWLCDAIDAYYLSGQASQLINGISLYSPYWEEVTEDWFDTPRKLVEAGAAVGPYVLSFPCSWGAMYDAPNWAAFRDWQRSVDATDPRFPLHSDTNIWPMQHSWKKYMILWMFLKKKAMVYPNLPNRLQFCTNRVGEDGVNQLFPDMFRLRYSFPLLLPARLSRAELTRLTRYHANGTLPLLAELPYFNSRFQHEGAVSQVLQRPGSFDLLHIKLNRISRGYGMTGGVGDEEWETDTWTYSRVFNEVEFTTLSKHLVTIEITAALRSKDSA